MAGIALVRVYEPGSYARPAYLVERLWPRGLRRDAIAMDGWCHDVAPSTELRRWFGHDPHRWPQFRERYRAELDANPEAWRPLADAAARGPLTLLYSSRDREHNNAVVLREYLLAHGAGAPAPTTVR